MCRPTLSRSTPKNLKKIKKIKSPGNLGESCRKNSAKLGENTAKMTRIFWLTHAQSMSKKLWVHSKKSVSEYEWAWVEQFSKCVSMSQVSVMLPKNPWVWVTESLTVLTHVLMSDSTRGISNPADGSHRKPWNLTLPIWDGATFWPYRRSISKMPLANFLLSVLISLLSR